MNLFAEKAGVRFFAAVNVPSQIAPLTFGQNWKVPLVVQVSDGTTAQDMTNWQCSAGFVGPPGLATGLLPGTPLAAFNAALVWMGGATLAFSGQLLCNTPLTSKLIGGNDFASSKFAVRFTLPNANPALVQEWESRIDCKIFAQVIEDSSLATPDLRPVQIDVPAGQMSATVNVTGIQYTDLVVFSWFSAGARDDSSSIQVNEDDPTQSTLTLNLTGAAPVGGSHCKAIIYRP